MFEKVVVIDGRDHLLGRLCSIIAKELLNGQKIVVVRAEHIAISGSLFRNKIRYWQFLKKRMNTNPARGPFHQRAPSKIVERTVRGMIPHKTARGKAALSKLQVFEGVPPQFLSVKKQCVPQAVRILRLKPYRKHCKLGDVSHEVGWKHQDLMAKLEAKRNERNLGWFEKKKEALKLHAQAKETATAQLPVEDLELLTTFAF